MPRFSCKWSVEDGALSGTSEDICFAGGGTQADKLKLELEDMKATIKAASQSLMAEKSKVRKAECAAHDADTRARKAQAQSATDDIACKQNCTADLHTVMFNTCPRGFQRS